MENNPNIQLDINSKHSFIHLGSLDSFDITDGGKEAAKLILEYLETGSKKHLKKAVHIYEKLIPSENFGGEYTALEWMCNYWLSPPGEQADKLSVPSVESFYELLSENDFENLKWYINRKYHFIEIERKDLDAKDRLRFLEDFILFCNPDRIRWEKTEENLRKLPLAEGLSIADVGSGPGYFSFKFCDIVGPRGKVYAIETNPKHLEYLRNYKKKNRMDNLEVVTSSFQGIGLPKDVRVDVVYMCSLYHNVYAAFTDQERDEFVASIRNALNDEGKFIIVDNDMVADEDVPYHGPHISRNLLISQLHYYGFELQEQFNFTVQRYVLVFTKKASIPESSVTHHAEFVEGSHTKINVTSSSSLVRYRIIGTSTSGYTRGGKLAALKMHAGLEKRNKNKLLEAIEMYKELLPKERIGSDYSALMWFCQVLADQEQRKDLKDPLYKDYFDFFAFDHFDRLKKYLRSKYAFSVDLPEEGDDTVHDFESGEVERGTLIEWEEYLTFNNPNRYLWEKTDEMLKFLDIKPGEAIADIGCGSGFFSYQFAKAAGKDGQVYATEINADTLAYLNSFIEKQNLNIKTLVAKLNNCGLEEDSVDTIFMCSMYHAVYIANIEFVKDDFIRSLKTALRTGGRLVVVDNDITSRDAPAYYGPGIAKELIIAQLGYYGFELESIKQLVPQRYILTFRVGDE